MNRFILSLLCMAVLSGCVTAMTPVASNVPIDSAEIAKSKLLGEDCFSFVFVFGPFGDASIKNVIAMNPGKKITLVDNEMRWYPFFRQYCQKVYGY